MLSKLIRLAWENIVLLCIVLLCTALHAQPRQEISQSNNHISKQTYYTNIWHIISIFVAYTLNLCYQASSALPPHSNLAQKSISSSKEDDLIVFLILGQISLPADSSSRL